MKLFIRSVFDGYGSFFALQNPLSKLLIFVCAMIQPASGFTGLLGGLCVVFWLRCLKLKSDNERIEIVNGILLGMLIGSLYAPEARTYSFIAAGSLLVVLISSAVSETLTKNLRLPLLGLPYALVSFLLLPVMTMMALAPASPALALTVPLPTELSELLAPLGAIYFNGTPMGGILVLLGFWLSSPYLALLALAASALCCLYLHLLAVPLYLTTSLVSEMNGVLTAAVIGGLFATPGRKSIVLSMIAALVACTMSLCATRLLGFLNLPILAVPFVLTTYLFVVALGRKHGGEWVHFWLTTPALAERTMEDLHIAGVRGVDPRSVGLRLPVEGRWHIYQEINGKHTHQGNWQFAIDLFQLDSSGKSFDGVGNELSEYYCFDKPVYSPAFGTIVGMRADLADNKPGDVDVANNWGNHVIVRLDAGGYCLLAHLRQNSIRVPFGARVYPGLQIGHVGNSGRSPQPHLHVQVQEGVSLESRTVPFHFAGVLTGGAEEKNYELNSRPDEGSEICKAVTDTVLKRAMNLSVGRRFLFEVSAPNAVPWSMELEVRLDFAGQFWLCAKTGARAAFLATDDLIAFYNRTGPADEAFDSYILALGLTPLAEGTLRWSDATPYKLLPVSRIELIWLAATRLWKPCLRSDYRRKTNAMAGGWTQTARFNIRGDVYDSLATISDTHGVAETSLSKNGELRITAKLVGFGLKEDNGIPERREDVRLTLVK